MTDPRNNAPRTRGRPFAPGNPGRPKGARHKVSRAVEALLEGEAEALTRKAVEAAEVPASSASFCIVQPRALRDRRRFWAKGLVMA